MEKKHTIYVDHAATTAMRAEVLEEMLPFFCVEFGNPSSTTYLLGRTSRKAIEDSRRSVADVLNCDANCIYFTSGGTESNNLALQGVISSKLNNGKRHIITSNIEHASILNTCAALESKGIQTTYVPVNKSGFVDPVTVEQAITDETALISIMTANNEIGTIQPIREIGAIAHDHGIPFHTDAVQAIGNMEINVKDDNIDILSLSAHKFGGPKGIGAIYIKDCEKIAPILHGGAQENGIRSGTENVAGIVGLGKAITLSYCDLTERIEYIRNLRNAFVRMVQSSIQNIQINGNLEMCLPGHANISFAHANASHLVHVLDLHDICVSAGSACSCTRNTISHVLKAIGLSDETAKETIRFSFGYDNTMRDIEILVQQLITEIGIMRNA